MKKTVCELFAGVGGFRVGLNHVKLENNQVKEDNTWDFVYANQWEPSTKTQAAYDCYIERFGQSKNHTNMDIHEVEKEDMPDFNLLVGGFPCQDYSVARTTSGEKGIEGKKGVLWWDIKDTIEAKKPPFILLENVDRLLRSPASQRGRDFGVMVRTLYDNDYGVQWRVINAGEYGFPQKRRRVFIFAYHKNTKYYKKITKKSSNDVIFKEGLFAHKFPIKDNTLEKGKKRITEKEYMDLVDISDNFQFHFYNTGLMHKGTIYTIKVEPDYKGDIYTLDKILEKNADKKYTLEGEKLEKFKYLKGSKKLKRKRPDGTTYNYSEGAVPFPERTDVPARTILTSEGNVSRTSHVVIDSESGEYRTLTPVECERIQMFPDNWTNISSKSMTERRRYFMMGNALVTGIVDSLGEELEDIFENED